MDIQEMNKQYWTVKKMSFSEEKDEILAYLFDFHWILEPFLQTKKGIVSKNLDPVI